MTLSELTNNSPVANVEAAFRAIEAAEADVRAWAHLGKAAALERARSTRLSGPLRGVPVGVKDIYDTCGLPTEYGSELYRGRQPEEDCAVVARLQELGAIVAGKTHTTGFAYFDPSPARNPHDLGRTPGGSSSGSAAAVAAGMVRLAVGSQTMGSVLRPASFCGVVGFMPTYGRVSLEGVLPLVPSLDHVGFFTPTAEEMEFFWSAFSGQAAGAPLEGPFALLDWPPGGGAEAGTASAMAEAAGRLRADGYDVRQTDAPASFQAAAAATLTVFAKEAAEVHRERFDRYGERIGAKLAALVTRGREISQDEYEAARSSIQAASRDFEEFAKVHPLTLTPAALGPAPLGLASTGDPAANAPWTALGGPAVSVPMPVDGMPLGLQLSSAIGTDRALLATASRLERSLVRAG